MANPKKITPDEIPTLTIEALAIGQAFKSTVGEVPINWTSALAKLPQIVKFFIAAAPHLKTIIAEIKD